MLEKIYQDFTTQVLPKIQEGLIITKDYFFDLFGRYVQYLIIMDGIWVAVSVIILGVCIKYAKRMFEWQKKSDEPVIALLIIPIIFATILFFVNITNLVKDIYIPEIRVIEQMRYVK